MKKILLIFVSIIFSWAISNVYAQKDTQQLRNEYHLLKEELMGTFQIQLINTRNQPNLPLDLLKTIKAKRETIFTEEIIVYSPYVHIRVIPRHMPNISKDELIIYKN
jgi:hypothetical protein